MKIIDILPEEQVKITYHREFSKQEYEMLLKGFTPSGMDDRWWIYYESNWVYIARSWTGFCIFKFKVNYNSITEKAIIKQIITDEDGVIDNPTRSVEELLNMYIFEK